MSKKATTEEFIEKAKQVHGNKYDYSKVEYINNRTPVCIICPIHGKFWQIPYSHLKGGCLLCGYNSMSKSKMKDLNVMLDKAKTVHNNKYDYSKVIKTDYYNKVCIICPEHGEFWQKLDNHLRGHGCPKCGKVHRLNKQEFCDISNKIHNNKYDYSKVEYVNNKTKVCINCPEHGEFWQSPVAHIFQKQGCPICKSSKLENIVESFLRKNDINFEKQKTFDWLKSKGNLFLDFYLPDYNIAIECQGRQHFEPVDAFGGKEEFERILERDKKKNSLCQENNINVLYYSSFKKDNMITSLLSLLKLIKNGEKIV